MISILKRKLWVLQLYFLTVIPFTGFAQAGAQNQPQLTPQTQLQIETQLSNEGFIQRTDDRIMIDLSEHRTPGQTGYFMFISKYNNLVNLAVPAGIFAQGVIANDKVSWQNAGYIASSSAVNLLFTFLVKQIVKRPRPFHGQIRINAVYQPGSTSFPSGHSSSAFTTAGALSQVYSKWYVIAPAYLWAGSVGYSRMYLGVHYPSDVAAGAVLGSASAISMRFLRPN